MLIKAENHKIKYFFNLSTVNKPTKSTQDKILVEKVWKVNQLKC